MIRAQAAKQSRRGRTLTLLCAMPVLAALDAQAWMPAMQATSLAVAKLLPVSPMTTGNLHSSRQSAQLMQKA